MKHSLSVLLSTLVLPLVLSANSLSVSSALAAPHCNPKQDSSACDPPNLDPNPPPPAPPPLNPTPVGQPPITITGPVQLISNGGFETGLVAPSALVSTTASPWSLRSLAAEVVADNPLDANNPTIPTVHHCGAHSLHVTSAQGWQSATQQIGVPIFAGRLRLDLWALFPRSDLIGDSISSEFDSLDVLLQTVPNDPSFGGNWSAGSDRIAAITSTSVGRGTWTRIGPIVMNGARYAGRTFSFQLSVNTANTGSGPQWGPKGAGYGFFLDDISLQAASSGTGAIPSPTTC